MEPISPLRPPSKELLPDVVDAVLVSERSVQRWWSFEEMMPLKFQSPRLVVKAHSMPWSADVVTQLGFDGQVQFDLSRPPWTLMHQLSDVIPQCTSRGWRLPTYAHSINDGTNLPDVTSGNQVNINILRLLAFGLNDKAIASALCLAPHTIRNRVSRMLGASGLESRTALALSYLRTHRLTLQSEKVESRKMSHVEANDQPLFR